MDTSFETCALCGKNGTFQCARCAEGVDVNGEPANTKYCGRECQAAHWAEHKPQCKRANERKVFHRTAIFLQQASASIGAVFVKMSWRRQM